VPLWAVGRVEVVYARAIDAIRTTVGQVSMHNIMDVMIYMESILYNIRVCAMIEAWRSR